MSGTVRRIQMSICFFKSSTHIHHLLVEPTISERRTLRESIKLGMLSASNLIWRQTDLRKKYKSSKTWLIHFFCGKSMWLQNMHKAECCYICSPLKSIIRVSHLSIFPFLPGMLPLSFPELHILLSFLHLCRLHKKCHAFILLFWGFLKICLSGLLFIFASKAATELLLYSTPNLTPIYKIDIDDFLICIYWSLVLMRFKYLKKKGDEVCLNYVLVWLVGYNEVNNIWREFVLMQSATEHLIISWRHH